MKLKRCKFPKDHQKEVTAKDIQKLIEEHAKEVANQIIKKRSQI